MTIWLESAGKDDLHGLRQHDLDEHLPGPQAERKRGLALAARHGIEARADDLGAVGGHIQRHRQNGGEDRIEPDADRRQAEEDEKELHQERRIAHDLDIAGDRLPEQAVPAARARRRRARREPSRRPSSRRSGRPSWRRPARWRRARRKASRIRGCSPRLNPSRLRSASLRRRLFSHNSGEENRFPFFLELL